MARSRSGLTDLKLIQELIIIGIRTACVLFCKVSTCSYLISVEGVNEARLWCAFIRRYVASIACTHDLDLLLLLNVPVGDPEA